MPSTPRDGKSPSKRSNFLVTVEWPDGRTKTLPFDPEETAGLLRELVFNMTMSAKGPISISIAKADTLKVLKRLKESTND